jgi:hypothetical protein
VSGWSGKESFAGSGIPSAFGTKGVSLATQTRQAIVLDEETLTFQVSVHSADIKAVLRAYSIEVSASSPSDLKEVSRHVIPTVLENVPVP